MSTNSTPEVAPIATEEEAGLNHNPVCSTENEHNVKIGEAVGYSEIIPNLASYNGFSNRLVHTSDKNYKTDVKSDQAIYDKKCSGFTVNGIPTTIKVNEFVFLHAVPTNPAENFPTIVWEVEGEGAYVTPEGVLVGLKAGGTVKVKATDVQKADVTVTSDEITVIA